MTGTRLHLSTLWLLTLVFTATIDASSALHLTGVTSVPDHPRAEVWSSFVHELIGEIAEFGQFTYNLRIQSGSSNGRSSSVADSLVAEVFNNRADFAIADIEVNAERGKLVDFTRPFLKSKLAALVRKHPPSSSLPTPTESSQPVTESSLNDANADADNQTTSVTSTTADSTTSQETSSIGAPSEFAHSLGEPPAGTLRSLLQRSRRTVVANSATERFFRTSKNPFVYHLLPSSVPNLKTGVRLVNSSDEYVLISDTVRLDLVTATECSLHVVQPAAEIPGEIGTGFELHYAIAIRKESPFFQLIDNALEQFEQSGGLEALVAQHWTDYCELANPKKKEYDFNDDLTNGSERRSIPVINCWSTIFLLFFVIFVHFSHTHVLLVK